MVAVVVAQVVAQRITDQKVLSSISLESLTFSLLISFQSLPIKWFVLKRSLVEVQHN